MSSRNANLTPAERSAAPRLYKALNAVREAVERGESSVDLLEQLCREAIKSCDNRAFSPESMISEIEYVNFSDAATMKSLQLGAMLPKGTPVNVSLAVKMSQSSVRLIDNIVIDPRGEL